MKHMKLVFLSFNKMKSSFLFLTVLLTLALFILLYLSGIIRYYHYSIERLEAADIKDSVYVKLSSFDEKYMENIYSASKEVQNIYNEIQELPGVDTVITLKSYRALEMPDSWNYTVYAYDDQTLERFSVPVDGSWFSNAHTDDGAVQAVLAGRAFNEYQLNENIVAKLNNESKRSITLHVTGKTKFPWYTLSFANSSTDILAHYLMEEGNVIIVKDDPSLRELFDSTDNILVPANAIVVFEENASEGEKQSVLDHLRSYGSYNTYENIIADSRQSLKTHLNNVLPIPLFLFFSAIVCLFSIASLYVLRNLENQVIYFLCGCSKRRGLLLMTQGLIVICLFPAIVNSIFVSIYPELKRRGILDIGHVILDYTSTSIILISLIVIISLLLLIPFFISRKNSPQQMYRRLSE
ncbi:hypothetical protein [Paenibacillus sp. J2TS4]|uniref:hypothetical protein n=1 Tax=Paenibacillus sp. J2TS4 TaxID=2807194 RepID=UPI001B22BB29|nr:hypothetical protein [Paenibacillus sp. J2TS4]GIP30977.1 hypothetical protein J2TS4_01870 [Paenibacillus sp. J2TS4]